MANVVAVGDIGDIGNVAVSAGGPDVGMSITPDVGEAKALAVSATTVGIYSGG